VVFTGFGAWWLWRSVYFRFALPSDAAKYFVLIGVQQASQLPEQGVGRFRLDEDRVVRAGYYSKLVALNHPGGRALYGAEAEGV
jgi:hypothetical protein